jgi:Fe2+ or Zn2+ uptake regulation protein
MIINRNNTGEMQGHPQTRQRQMLLEILRGANRHVDAKELFRLASVKDSTISPATVYRNLKLFKELELIKEKRVGRSCRYFEVKGSPDHQHLVCAKCGKVVDFDCPLSDMVQKVKSEKGFIVTKAEVYLEGRCAECNKEEKE